MKKYIALVCLSLILNSQFSIFSSASAQKPKQATEFTVAGLPDELLEWMNKSTSDGDRQKENTKTIKAFRSVYSSLDNSMQERLVGVYTYAVKAKMKGNPEVCGLTRVLTAIATTPAGGTSVANAYGNAPNFDGFVTSLEALKKRAAKPKAVTEYVDFCETLFSDRVLYRSNSCEWRFDAKTPFRLGVEDGKLLVWFDVPANLSYASSKDQNVIHGTTGVYDYKENLWQGEGGRIDWGRTGLNAEVCYADLGKYKAETKFPKFSADSVRLVNTHYFSDPVIGKVEDVLSNAMEPEKYSYPRFRSYKRDFVIKNILPDVDYRGSFMMNGAKFLTASSKHPASLVFNTDGKPRMAVTSLKMTFTQDRVVSENATVAFYIGEDDSISNTGVTVRYNAAEHRVVLSNDQQRNYYCPYIDSYHGLDIYSDDITWITTGSELEFSNLTTTGSTSMATFESSNCYTYRKARDIQGIEDVSPVRRVYEFAEGYSYNFPLKAFSDNIGLDISQTQLMIHNLARYGLVSYNEMTGRVQVNQKLEDYVKAESKAKGFDYDALSLESNAKGYNARMSLDDYLLKMRGVKQFVVSDSQKVVVYPKGGNITVGKNRAIGFTGRIDVGRFIMFVSDADFNYEQFSFELPRVDSLFFYVPEFDNPDTDHMVMTPLYGLVGSLRVDKPDNHCGLTKNKEYPIFESRENSYVYYDKRDICGGKYVRDRFYYTLHPFTINSLVDFVTDELQFNGVLNSGGIFPDITYPLSVQRDYYLGFQVETPAGGYPAYGGKGTYNKKITLDHFGLKGSGDLDYLTSTTRSKNYLFLLDSMSATTDTFFVREEQGFPDIRGGKLTERWYPYMDSMAVATTAKGRPFRMYHDDAQFRGRIDLTPKGATAAGTATVREGTLVSPRFDLLAMEMNAEVSDFTLQSTKRNAVAFSAKHVRSHVDYDKRIAELRIADGPARTELQLVKQAAYADVFTWNMDRKVLDIANSTRPTSEGMDAMDIRMRLQKRGDLPGVRFVGTAPEAKELSYHSLLSTYDYERGELSSQGVFLINVADAAIAPAADSLHIHNGGKMGIMANAKIIFNRDSAWHYVTGADVMIASAEKYTGKGYMDYHNDTKKTQRLFLNDIAVNGRGVTVASGTISDSASFTISSAFGFAGKVRAEGDHALLYFEGGVRLLQPCIPKEQLGLLAYKDYTDPEHVHVAVPEQATDWHGRRIATSILLERHTLKMQPAFLTDAKIEGNELLSAHGVLTYLGDRKQYMIASEAKVSDPDIIVEPYLAMSTTDCNVEGEGLVNLTLRKSQASFYAYGTTSVGIQDDKEDHLATVFGMTFPLAKDVVEGMYNNIKEDLRLSFAMGNTNPELRHAMMYHLGADKGAGVYAMYSTTGKLSEIPAPMQSTLLFDHVRWQHNPAVGLYYDGKVTLVAMGDKPVGLEMRLKAQISKRGNTQIMTFYIEAAKDHWYFFKYDVAGQELTIYGSDGAWLDKIKAIPLDQRKIEKEGMGTFRYFVGNNSGEVPNWLQWFSRTVYQEND